MKIIPRAFQTVSQNSRIYGCTRNCDSTQIRIDGELTQTFEETLTIHCMKQVALT